MTLNSPDNALLLENYRLRITLHCWRAMFKFKERSWQILLYHLHTLFFRQCSSRDIIKLDEIWSTMFFLIQRKAKQTFWCIILPFSLNSCLKIENVRSPSAANRWCEQHVLISVMTETSIQQKKIFLLPTCSELVILISSFLHHL